jgi:hypothetical protein
MRNPESTKPHAENAIVDAEAPKQEFFDFNDGHGNISQGEQLILMQQYNLEKHLYIFLLAAMSQSAYFIL